MEFFYGAKNHLFKSEIQIPTFTNRNFFANNEYKLCKCYIKDNKWQFKKLLKNKIENKFYIIKNDEFLNEDFFFLIKDNDFDKLSALELKVFEKFSVRANLKIYLDKGGFSSYQSEYPYALVKKKGRVTCPVSSLANINAEYNYILFRNIFERPINEKFKSYLVNIKSNKKIHEFDMYTNTTNILELNKDFIKPEIYFVTDKYVGIPSFLSFKNNHISFEHTHPPHAYILNPEKFDLVNKMKKKFNEIIN